MIRGSKNWQCRTDIVLALKTYEEAAPAIEDAARKWGVYRVHSVWRTYVKPDYLKIKKRVKRNRRRHVVIEHPFAEMV